MLYEKTTTQIDPKREHKILDFWAKERIFWESMKIRESGPKYVFFEGPPTANGTPHPGHVLTKAIKDLIPRYKTMCGYYVGRKAGWDTHGLPVELEVEKELGIEGKRDIEKYGVENFIKKCKESVFRYEKEWRAMVERGGFWIDMDDPYITCTNEYIESVWWMLGRFWKAGLLYEGHKVVPYCPRCGTALSSHEVALGYDETEDPSVFVKFKIKNKENTYFLVWTTTPWTLISNVALAIGVDIDYIEVKLDNNENLILAKERWEVIKNKGEIIKTYKGFELLNWEYEPLFTYVKPDKRAFYVIKGDFVSTQDGTGIVHIAPAFGEEDYKVGRENDLPVLQPVDLEGKFTKEVTPWNGMFVKNADPEIIKHLKETGKLLYATTYKHTYPFCWRCNSPLLYYARHSWFIKTTAYKDEVLANNEKINWFPDYIKDGRFKNFLENMVDWAISRDRYWGTPLPIWVCSCGHKHLVESIAELKTKSKNCPDNIELHKPYVDEVELICDVCKGTMKRVPEVIDCWFDSGAMHTAQWHYPFENKEKFEQNFPADFICEAIDQTRGWFYSLLVTSTFVHKSPPYKNVVVLGLICDKNGIKMSKSKGNVLDCMSLFEKYGADAVRWSLYSGTAPWNTRRFYEEHIAESQRRFLGTLQNVYSFYVMYANVENFNPLNYSVPVKERPYLDRWIISRFNNTVKDVRNALDIFEITKATTALETFVDQLSNWYVRRSRRRFWSSEQTIHKISAFLTLYEVLVGLSKLLAPFVPFITEDIWQNLVCRIDKNAPKSVHLSDYPICDESLIEYDIEKSMDYAMKVVVLGRAARNVANIKVRQPLSVMKVLVNNLQEQNILKELNELITDELNIKMIEPISDVSDLVEYSIKPNYKNLGQTEYKAYIPAIKEHLEKSDPKSVVACITKGYYTITVDGKNIKLSKDEIEVNSKSAPDWIIQQEGNTLVALNKVITRDLMLEGMSREIVNKVQNMRKEAKLDIVDRISIEYTVLDKQKETDVIDTFKYHGDYIKQETLALNISNVNLADTEGVEWNINGIRMKIKINKEVYNK